MGKECFLVSYIKRVLVGYFGVYCPGMVYLVKAVTILRTNKIVQSLLVFSVYCWLLAREDFVLAVEKL